VNADTIVIDMFYPQPVGQVWAALTSSQALEAWLMPNDFEPRLGHRFTFHTTPDQSWDGIVHCEIVALDRLRRIAYTWRSPSSHLDTLVTFTIEPAEGGTHLRLEHSGFASGGKAGLTVRDLLASGWKSRVLPERLAAYLDEQAPRDTLSPVNDDDNQERTP
jgi:uncharacterized protein YndB with AHSA1/START domain